MLVVVEILCWLKFGFQNMNINIFHWHVFQKMTAAIRILDSNHHINFSILASYHRIMSTTAAWPQILVESCVIMIFNCLVEALESFPNLSIQTLLTNSDLRKRISSRFNDETLVSFDRIEKGNHKCETECLMECLYKWCVKEETNLNSRYDLLKSVWTDAQLFLSDVPESIYHGSVQDIKGNIKTAMLTQSECSEKLFFKFVNLVFQDVWSIVSREQSQDNSRDLATSFNDFMKNRFHIRKDNWKPILINECFGNSDDLIDRWFNTISLWFQSYTRDLVGPLSREVYINVMKQTCMDLWTKDVSMGRQTFIKDWLRSDEGRKQVLRSIANHED